MRNGVCPQCSSQNVFTARGGLSYGGDGSLRAHIEPGFRGMRPTQRADDVWQYVCVDCGYLEAYMLGEADLSFVRQHWIAVPPSGAAGGPTA